MSTGAGTTPSLTDVLLARIAEDEAQVEKHLASWGHSPNIGSPGPCMNSEYLDMTIGPYRVLAECAAKRRIVEEYAARDTDVPLMLGEPGTDPRRQREWSGLRFAVSLLAAIYADHPDFDPAWRI